MAASDENTNMDNRTPEEKTFFELIEKSTNEAVIAHVKASKVKIDCHDHKGMSPLQLAAFRGNKDLCEFLLANGADVNWSGHEDGYTALMFAALSGKTDVTRLLLEAGAKTTPTNKVNRTAGQMAAFVGQHQCVSVINNFFPLSDIEYFTKPQGLEKEAKLPASVAPTLCTLINFANIHPVKIAVYLRDHPILVEEGLRVCRVLGRLVDRNMKTRDINDIMAIKCHFIQTMIKMARDATVVREAGDGDKQKSMNTFIKGLMKGREGDGFMEIQERIIRQSLKDFPYANSALLQQLVRQIAPVKIGNDPTAFSVLTSSLNGQQFGWDAGDGCDTCWEAGAKNKCSKCQMVKYCNQDCQRLHWPTHKKFCAKLAEEFKVMEKKRLKEEERKKEEEAKDKLEDTKSKEEEARKQLEDIKLQEEEALKQLEEAEKKEAEARKELENTKLKVEEAKNQLEATKSKLKSDIEGEVEETGGAGEQTCDAGR